MLYIKEPATHMHICGNNEGLSLKYSLTCIYLKLANVLRVRAPNCPAKSFTKIYTRNQKHESTFWQLLLLLSLFSFTTQKIIRRSEERRKLR